MNTRLNFGNASTENLKVNTMETVSTSSDHGVSESQHIASSLTENVRKHDQAALSSPAFTDKSTDSSRTSTTSTPSSDPQYSKDVCERVVHATADANVVEALLRQDSGSSSTKTCEVDLGDEERDTFSPISSNSNTPSDGVLPASMSTDSIFKGAPVSSTANTALVNKKAYAGNTNTNGSASGSNSGFKMPSTVLNNSGNLHHSTTKEEKQRQNEEIVIMETSSIASETGSWDSVYTHAPSALVHSSSHSQKADPSFNIPDLPAASDVRGCCTESLHNERKSLKVADEKKEAQQAGYEEADFSPFKTCGAFLRERTFSTGTAVTADTSSLFTNAGSTSSLLRDLEKRENGLSTLSTSACFIDASSLRDEDEVLSFPSLDSQCSNDGLKQQEGHAADLGHLTIEKDESPTKKLETFHRAFAKCKVKSKDLPIESTLKTIDSISSDSNSGPESPGKVTVSEASPTSTNNLSDEEKLWKRDHDTSGKGKNVEKRQKDSNTNKHAMTDDAQQCQHLAQEDATEASVSLAGDIYSSDSSEALKSRREQERKPASICAVGSGHYRSQHNMQQFSVHSLAAIPKFQSFSATNGAASHPNPVTTTAFAGAAITTATHLSDLSYTTDYSSSSPAPSLVWSENEHRPSSGVLNDSHLQRPNVLPETPHNSMVHVDLVSSNASSIHRDYTLSSSLSHQRDSGAYCSDATDSPIPMPRTPKRSKFDEANPIVSGGASIKDFEVKPCESPTIKRRTDTCPIVSGGFVSLDFEKTRPVEEDADDGVQLRVKPNSRKPVSGIASWVVDMSDYRAERRKSTSSTSSLEASLKRVRERSDSTSSHKSACGFYIPLNDMDKNAGNDERRERDKEEKTQMSKSYNIPKSTGFFVNFSKSEYQEKSEDKEATSQLAGTEQEMSDSRKNIFSMFIDIGGNKPSSKKEPFNITSRLSSSLSNSSRRKDEELKSNASSTETLMSKSNNLKLIDHEKVESKWLDYRCNMEAPILVAAVRRISHQQNAQNDPTKRHSWGTNNQKKEASVSHNYKRSISLTVNNESKEPLGSSGLMSIIDKIPFISKASLLSMDSSMSPYEEYMGGSKSELSTFSNNSARNSMSGGEREGDLNVHANGNVHALNTSGHIKRRRRNVQINETFDKSSVASITDGVLSKDLSPASATDTDDWTFQQDEEVAVQEAAALQLQQQQQVEHIVPLQLLSTSNRSSAIVMETIIEAKETSSPKKKVKGHDHAMESLHATIEKQKMLLETVNESGESDRSKFVKLSDMDKPVKFEPHSPEAMMSKSAGNHRQINRLFRDDSKGRPHSWTMTRSTGNSFMNITNSVENLRSLSRLFPNFSKQFSSSLPNDMILDHMEYMPTDISADSSLASSFTRSAMDESSISCRQPRRLGEDLLKMFLQEIATDMIVEVHGRRLKAHKCILRSRCQYFAGMLAGGGSQSVVSLQGYSYSAVHFAMCHIYSGASHPPDGISLMELAALADLLGLEGLKEVTAHALKTNYCHNFHKPCSGCIDGILQVLPVALNHALDDLYRKCLRWTCRHYLKVWPTRQFAQLPPDIHGRCKQQIVAHLGSDTVLDTLLDCDTLLGQLSPYRWGAICENLVRDILEASYLYMADHFASLIASDAFLSLGNDRSCNIPRLEGILLRTAAALTPDQACRSYQRITRLNTVLQTKVIQMPADLGDLAKELQGLQEEKINWDDEYIRLVSSILSAIEQCLIRQCSRAMRVTSWQRMDLDLRKKIQTLARLSEPIEAKRSKPVSKAFSFGGSTRSQDLIQVKLAIQAHSKRALAQDTQLYKATQTYDAVNIQTAERGVQANHDMREHSGKIMKSNSRVYVPQGATRSTAATISILSGSDRHSLKTHQRTQSEATASNFTQKPTERPEKLKNNITSKQQPQQQSQVTAKAPLHLTDIRSRYLEPRKPRVPSSDEPIRSATTSSIPATTKHNKGRQLSSSDSSRNSSPAARKIQIFDGSKIGTKSVNMSLDNLTSSSMRGKLSSGGADGRKMQHKTFDNDRYSDAGFDSQTESMRSSIIINKAISQESLGQAAKISNSTSQLGQRPQLKSADNDKLAQNFYSARSRSISSTNNSNKSTTMLATATTRHLSQHHHITSTGSSPSSVTTTKSATSRLSSVSSTQSTRDMYKHRSISVPTGQENHRTNGAQTSQRVSFLSAKSREILAKRAEKKKQLQLELEHQNRGSAAQPQQLDLQQAKQFNHFHEDRAFKRTARPLRSASHTAVIDMAANTAATNHNSLPSNIPTRRPNTLTPKNLNCANGMESITTTITTTALNKSNKQSTKANNRLPKPLTVTANNSKISVGYAGRQKIDRLSDGEGGGSSATSETKLYPERTKNITSPSYPNKHIESKLERSSTFCKDNSDLDISELQIIE